MNVGAFVAVKEVDIYNEGKGGGRMNTNQWVLLTVAVLSGGYALYQGVVLLALRNRMAQTIGTITDIATVNKNGTKGRNSAWASFYYKVDGHMVYSDNRIQVPMISEQGSQMLVYYRVDAPELLVSVSYKRLAVGAVIAVGCGLVAIII